MQDGQFARRQIHARLVLARHEVPSNYVGYLCQRQRQQRRQQQGIQRGRGSRAIAVPVNLGRLGPCLCNRCRRPRRRCRHHRHSCSRSHSQTAASVPLLPPPPPKLPPPTAAFSAPPFLDLDSFYLLLTFLKSTYVYSLESYSTVFLCSLCEASVLFYVVPM
jgi:hypothetical protein